MMPKSKSPQNSLDLGHEHIQDTLQIKLGGNDIFWEYFAIFVPNCSERLTKAMGSFTFCIRFKL